MAIENLGVLAIDFDLGDINLFSDRQENLVSAVVEPVGSETFFHFSSLLTPAMALPLALCTWTIFT